MLIKVTSGDEFSIYLPDSIHRARNTTTTRHFYIYIIYNTIGYLGDEYGDKWVISGWRVKPLASIQQIQYVMKMGSNTDSNDDWKNFTPRQNAPIDNRVTPDNNAITASELTKLDDMSKEELKTLVRRVCGASSYIELSFLSQEEIKEATRLRLADIALRNKDDKIALQAIQQLLDRLEGKPIGTAPNINIGGGNG